LILTPIDLLKAWVRASVLLISRENISLPAIDVKGVSGPRDCAIPTFNNNKNRLFSSLMKRQHKGKKPG
jgi:hypothetical protein